MVIQLLVKADFEIHTLRGLGLQIKKKILVIIFKRDLMLHKNFLIENLEITSQSSRESYMVF